MTYSTDTEQITKIVAYYRLSKPKRGKSKAETIRDAYGIEDQRREVRRLSKQLNAPIIGEFSEIETGTRKKMRREELEKAIIMARRQKATIVIGKQDRLARNVALVANLMNSGVHFVPADRPNQSRFEAHIRASVDEEEARRISDRVKRGMAIAREKGVKFGSARPGHWKGREHRRGFKQATAASVKNRLERCRRHYADAIGVIIGLQAEGLSLAAIAEELNEKGMATTSMKPFTAMAVHRVIKLYTKPRKPR